MQTPNKDHQSAGQPKKSGQDQKLAPASDKQKQQAKPGYKQDQKK